MIKVEIIRNWARIEYVRRLDVRPEEWSTCRQKASCRKFEYRAEGLDIAPRRSEGEDDAPKDRMKRRMNQ